MKKLSNTLLLFMISASLSFGQAFITTWKTDNPGTSNDNQITIPTTGTGYSYDISWEEVGNEAGNNGSEPAGQTGNYTITFPSSGTYRISITGDFPRIYFNNEGDKDKIIAINQWGTQVWSSMGNAFFGTSNLEGLAADVPDLSIVTDMSRMFFIASVFNQDIGNWDVSNVTRMDFMFAVGSFNQDIGNWDVSKVNNMEQIFSGASVFNQDISNWDVSNATILGGMFRNATAFNQDISSWNVSSATSVSWMFWNATSFNQNLGSWDVSKVTNMNRMFNNASAFNQDLSNWDVSKVTNMTNMFDDSGMSSVRYDQTLRGWATQSLQSDVELGATGLEYCSENGRQALADNFNWTIIGDNQNIDCPFITTWKTDNVGTSNSNQITIPTGVASYFYDVDWGDGTFDTGVNNSITHTYSSPGTYTISLSGNFPTIYFNNGGDKDKILTIEHWGDIVWSTFRYSFWGCNNLEINASDAPDLSNVTNMVGAFRQATSFNSNINHWDVSNVEFMNQMFFGAASFNQPLNNWVVDNVLTTSAMFGSASSFNQPLDNWNVGNVQDMSGMFDFATAFNQPIGNWNVENVTKMNNMLRDNDFNQDISGWNTGKVTTMNAMFRGSSNFDQNIGGWDISSVTDLAAMFFQSGLSSENYDNLLIGWAAQTVKSGLTVDVSNVDYCAGSDARDILTGAPNNWIINDGDEYCVVDIPDTNFKTALLANASINTTDDGEITYTEAEAFTGTIDVSSQSISDLTGIEAFTEITQLKANSNTLTEVDVSNNTKLEVLWIRNNALSAIDVSNNVQLTQLFLNGNEMTEIDLTSNVLMDELSLFDNNLSTIDISTLVDLTELSIRGNQLSSIDVNSNVNLLKLYIHSNSITTVDLSNNTLLTDLFCDNNSIASLDFTNNPNLRVLRTNNNELVSLDLSSNTAITQLSVDNNQLAELNIANGNNSNFTLFEASNNGSLSCITVDDVAYAEANFTNVDAAANFSTDCSNTANDITAFSFTEQSSAATIGSGVIDIEVTVGTDLSSLTPTFSLSTGATVDPASGVAQDFSSAFIYTVTAENPTATQEWTITVIEENVVPTDIKLDNLDIAENNSAGEVIGVLSTTDGNVADTHSYTLVAGAGDADNAAFTISGNELKASESFDFETQSTYSTRLQANDGNGGTFEKAFTVNVNNLENAAQSISFDELTTSTFGDGPFDLVASATSGLPLTFESSNEEVASISGSTVTIIGAGTTEITATQSGNVDYASAGEIIKTLTVDKATQEISFALVESLTYGAEALELQASSSSELAVSYNSADESIATINGNILNVVGIGTVTITASQTGNTNYLATEQSRELIVSPAQLNISADEVSRSYGEANPALSYSITGLVYQEDESILTTLPTITTEANEASDVGEYAITISGAEATNYAISYSNSVLVIEKANQEITIESISDKILNAVDFEVVAATTSDLELTYEVLSGPATNTGNFISLTGEIGNVEIQVSQSGNDNYNAATATTTFEVLADPCEGFAATTRLIQNVACNGGSDGSFEVNLSHGTVPFTYTIQEEFQDNGLFENLAAGSYTVIVTDANGCTAEATMDITAPEAISIAGEVTQNNSIDGNASISLAVTGGSGDYTYSWSEGSTTATIENLLAGVYEVTVTDTNGCTARETFEVAGVTANNIEEANQVQFYPNPAVATLNVVHALGVKTIKLYDAKGVLINTHQVNAQATQTALKVDQLNPGMYFIQLDEQQLNRIVKK